MQQAQNYRHRLRTAEGNRKCLFVDSTMIALNERRFLRRGGREGASHLVPPLRSLSYSTTVDRRKTSALQLCMTWIRRHWPEEHHPINVDPSSKTSAMCKHHPNTCSPMRLIVYKLNTDHQRRVASRKTGRKEEEEKRHNLASWFKAVDFLISWR